LLNQIVVGKLSIPAACQRYALGERTLIEWLRAFRRATVLAFDQRLKQRLIEQGAAPGDLGGTEFTGTLSELSIGDLVQFIELAGKNARISVTHDGRESRLWCMAGAIIDAESGRLTGEHAAYRILALEQGRFFAELRESERERSVITSTQGLLLEAARRNDEATRLREKLGDERRRYALGPAGLSAADAAGDACAATLRLFESSCSLSEALEQSVLGDFETLCALCRLVHEGWLVDLGLPALRSEEPIPGAGLVPWRPEPPPTRLRSALGAVGARVLVPAASWLNARLAARDGDIQYTK
jgi:hypothetical protein